MVSQERLAHLAQFTDEHLAYHEAGHAVVHYLQGGTIVRLSIERTDPKQGMHPGQRPTPTESADQQKALRDLVALLVAGEVAATIHGAPENVVKAGGRVDREHAIRRAAELGVNETAARARPPGGARQLEARRRARAAARAPEGARRRADPGHAQPVSELARRLT